MKLTPLILLALSKAGLAMYGGHFLFKSIREVKKLLASEKDFIPFIRQAEQDLTGKSERQFLEKYVESYEALGIESWTAKQIEDPFSAYLLIRHIALCWEDIHLKGQRHEKSK